MTMIDKSAAAQIMRDVAAVGLLTNEEISYVTAAMQPCHAFADGVKMADTLHLNIKVDDIACLPEEFAYARGAKKENAKDGYVKYAFPGNVNVILSAINISQDDLIEAKPGTKKPRPFLDHVGIDLRRDRPGSSLLRCDSLSRVESRLAYGVARWRRQGRVLLPRSGEREALGLPARIGNGAFGSARIRLRSAGFIGNAERLRPPAG
jgi:hypothetical protein